MATTKDSNKLTIYKGGDEDYAFIPLDISENTHYDFTNSIIYNDGSTYIKNITSDSELYKLVKDKLLDASAPAIRDKQEDPKNPTISINKTHHPIITQVPGFTICSITFYSTVYPYCLS